MARPNDIGTHRETFSSVENEHLRKLAFEALHLLSKDESPLEGHHYLKAIHHSAVFGSDEVWSKLVHGQTSNSKWLEIIIPGVAELLGQDWLEDRLSFAQVTLATARLQQAARASAARQRKEFFAAEARPSALIIVPSSCDHTLGAVTMAALLLERGINAITMIRANQADALQRVATHDFDAVFLSWSYPETLENAQNWIVKMRDLVEGPTRFGVGGSIFNHQPDHVVAGADLYGNEIEDAAQLCRTSFEIRTNNPQV